MAPHTVKYSLPGTQPPIYLAGSFSDPAWQPQEMQYTAKGDEYEFYKEIDVKPGEEYQYKFRVGPGDWWVLNEASPTVTDAIGNRNNLLVAPKQPEAKPEAKPEKPLEPSSTKMDETTPSKLDVQTENKEKAAPSGPPSPVPQIVVEKVDSSPSHGDDFGLEATQGQKEAHEKRSEDSEPDYVVVRAESQSPDTPDSSVKQDGSDSQSPEDVAAEVADSADAASLDQDPPTPTITDDEAGRIGFRRMSNTPIPQVAATAAEVADVAAALGDDADTVEHAPTDKADFKIEMPAPPSEADFEDDDESSGAATPWEDRVPKFPHEMVTPPDPDHMIPLEKVRSVHDEYKPQKSPFIEAVYDPNDPNYEEFPSDREAILARLSQSLRNYPEDDTLYEDAPDSPVSSGAHRQSDHLAPSPNMTARSEERSLSLHSIPEADDHDHRDEILASIPDAATESKGTEVFEGIGAGHEDEEAEAPKERKPSFDVHEVGPDSPPIDDTEEDKTNTHITPAQINTPTSSEITPESGPSILVSPATPGLSTKQMGEPPASEPANAEKVAAIEEENGRSPTETESDKTPPKDIPEDIEPEAAAATENTSTKPVEQEPAKVVAPEQEEGNQLKSRQKSPENVSTSTDTAKSSSVEQGTGLTSRKQVSPSQDRAPSSNSLRTNTSEVKSKNFLTSFFRLIFVDWIGGIIVKLCGGRKNA